MSNTLRQLLIQRAARLQERPALTTAAWGTLTWSAWRNRVEGLAMGLLAAPLIEPLHSCGHGPWDWAAEVAVACCGWTWAAGGQAIPEAVLGGPSFNAEEGRGLYHDREKEVLPATPFTEGLTHEDLLGRLQTWNHRLGWDHTSTLAIASEHLGSSEGRAALWCALYAGAHVQALEPSLPAKGLRRWLAAAPASPLDLQAFQAFWLKGIQ